MDDLENKRTLTIYLSAIFLDEAPHLNFQTGYRSAYNLTISAGVPVFDVLKKAIAVHAPAFALLPEARRIRALEMLDDYMMYPKHTYSVRYAECIQDLQDLIEARRSQVRANFVAWYYLIGSGRGAQIAQEDYNIAVALP